MKTGVSTDANSNVYKIYTYVKICILLKQVIKLIVIFHKSITSFLTELSGVTGLIHPNQSRAKTILSYFSGFLSLRGPHTDTV